MEVDRLLLVQYYILRLFLTNKVPLVGVGGVTGVV
jgi:hypothetical protein